MKVFQSISQFKSNKKTTVTIGTFDGVHLGHQSLLKKLKTNSSCESVLITFFPHPRMVLQVESEIKLLNTIEEKTILLEKNNIENLIIHPFDKAFSRLTAEEFVEDILVKQLNIDTLIIGHDHRFGRNRSATVDDLIDFGKKYNFNVEQISAKEINEIAISSTKIRSALDNGNIKLANSYLGYNYSITGKVVKGLQNGRSIGFPTANILIEENYKLIPKNGVYAVKTTLKNKTVFGMLNIGNNPTIGLNKRSIEVHFFDFNDDIYDEKISLSLLNYFREEKKFNSLEALKEQLLLDKEAVLKSL